MHMQKLKIKFIAIGFQFLSPLVTENALHRAIVLYYSSLKTLLSQNDDIELNPGHMST